MFHKTQTLYLILLLALGMFTACKDEGDDPAPNETLEVQTATDVYEAEGYAFFDLESGQMLSKSDSSGTQWDLAFDGTSIITNSGISGPGEGGAQIIDGVFEEVDMAPGSGYATDGEASLAIPGGGGNGWYNYTDNNGNPAHAILPIPGKLILLKTGEGNYAKVEIISYYEGNPDTTTEEFASLETRPESGHYTFQYMVQPNGSTDF
ncbi:HmuY family protein [Catalinimonas sp. 4WD22]|uniref:HmuY family protein n=1 Tax=Catalinimonas locisalis TaxID=3133978 RepID=UPI003101117C